MKSIFFAIAVVMLTSCGPSLRYYTKEINDSYGWTPEQLQKVQFYLSEDIILYRNATNGEGYVEEGKIRSVNGHKSEEIIIKQGTKGVFLFSPKDNQYAISFDENDNSKYLVFGPSPKVRDRYVLLAKEWSNRNGKVTYGEEVYSTPATSAFAYLMVDYKSQDKVSRSRTVAGGRRVSK
jgi:hypothetical protein